MLAASREAMTNKREAVRRFLWVYLNAEEQMAKKPELLQFNGYFHGGVVSGLADHAAGAATIGSPAGARRS